MALPISGPWIISGIPSPQRAAAKALRGSRATRAAGQGRRARSPHTPAAPRAPAPDHPSQRAEREDRDREGEPQGDVRIAFAEAPAEAILLVIWHDADGNIPACEKFRKQSHNHANLCGAWEYDVLTWSQHDGKPIPHLATVRESFRA